MRSSRRGLEIRAIHRSVDLQPHALCHGKELRIRHHEPERAAQLLDLELIVIKHVSDQADDAAPDRWIDAVAMSSKELAVWLDANHR